jgi:hypothetical protein
MKTSGELRAQAQHWREVAATVSDPAVLQMIRELIEELERRGRLRERRLALLRALWLIDWLGRATNRGIAA